MIKVAIVGAGYIGKIHASMCKEVPDVSVVAVVDKVEEKGKILASHYDAKFYPDMDLLFDNEDVDAVAICTPNDLHAEMVKKAASAKKNIFCEKPLALSLKEADEMIEAVKRNKVKSMVGHVIRFFPEYKKVKEIVDGGELGTPLNALCERNCVAPDWSEEMWYLREDLSGGSVLSLQIHDIDYLNWIFGKPSIVESQGTYNLELGGWAHMGMNIRYEGGQYGLIDSGWAFKGKFPFTTVLRVLCDNGTIEWIFRGGKNIEERGHKEPIKIYKSDGSIYEEKASNIDPFYLEWEYFINCLENNKDINNATFEDARAALKVGLAAIESAKTMRAIKI